MTAAERLWDRGRWDLRRHAPLLWWLATMGWLAWGVRLTLTTDATLAGAVDDAAFVALTVALFGLAELLDRIPRAVAQAALAVALVLAVLADALHFRFFGSYVNAEDVAVAGEMGAAAGSVFELLTPWVIVCGAVVPLVLAGFAVRAALGFRRRRPSRTTIVLLLSSMVLVAVHWLEVGGLATAAYNNPVMLFGRQLALGSITGETLSDEEMWEAVREHADEAYNWPDPERWTYGEWPDHPLLKLPRTDEPPPESPPNVVVILMESVRGYETEMGRGADSVTPHLDRLGRESLTVSDYYMVGHQTVRGEAAVLCSTFTHYGGAPIYVRYAGVRMKCLPEILRDHGYSTHWISSFRSNYFNKDGFLSQHGVDHFHDMGDYRGTLERPRIGWGPADEDMMEYAVEVLGRSDRPFFASVMTLSNHHPFDHPYPTEDPPGASDPSEGRLYRDYLRGTHYTDQGVGHFFEVAREQDWFEDTIFVVTGDHGARAFPAALDADRMPAQEAEVFYRGVLLIKGPGVTPGQLDMVASQVDVAPTVLDIMDIEEPSSFMGVSLLDETVDDRFAVFASATEWYIRQGDRYCYAIGTSCLDDGWPACTDDVSMTAAAHACFETEHDLLRVRDARVGSSMRLLPEDAARELELRGERVVTFTNFLLEQDAIFPYPAELPDGTRGRP